MAFAASAALATKTQIDNIKSQSFSGGGGVSVTGGAGGGVSTGADFNGGAPSGAGEQKPAGGVTNITLTGQDQTFTSDQVDGLFDQISEAMERGDKVLFTSSSRQAIEVAQ